MRTARVLTVSPSMLCAGGGGGCTWSGGVPGPRGGGEHLVPGGVPGPGGTWSGGSDPGGRGVVAAGESVPGLGGVPGPGGYLVGGCLLWGVSAPGGGGFCTWSKGGVCYRGVYLVPGGGGGAPGPGVGSVPGPGGSGTPPCEQNHRHL